MLLEPILNNSGLLLFSSPERTLGILSIKVLPIRGKITIIVLLILEIGLI